MSSFKSSTLRTLFILILQKQLTMPTKKPAVKKNAPGKEKILKTIKDQLSTTLSKLKEQLGEKKFEKRIKKAAKVLVAGIKKQPVKKPVVTAKKSPVAAKKAAKKK
jgi:hypothetical protein